MTEPKTPRKTKTAPEPSEAQYAEQYRSVVDQLHAQEKEKVRLYQTPADSSDEKLPPVTVAVNGHVYTIQRGVRVEVPKTVAEILEHAGHI